MNKDDSSILIIGFVIGAVIVGLLVDVIVWQGWHDQETRFLAAQPEITLSNEEKLSLVDATASFAKNDAKPLNQWISRLAEQKRWGLLPALPARYSNDWVEMAQKRPVLLPKKKIK